MMQHEMAGMRFESPDSMQLEETKWILREPVNEALADPRLSVAKAVKPVAVRPNLIVHRKPTPTEDLDAHVAKIIAELMQSVMGLEQLSQAKLTFDDGQVGRLAVLAFSPMEAIRLCQFHAFRLDDGILTTFTWTLDAKDFNDEKQAECVKFIASACPAR